MRRVAPMVTGMGTRTNTVIDTHATMVGRMTTTVSSHRRSRSKRKPCRDGPRRAPREARAEGGYF